LLYYAELCFDTGEFHWRCNYYVTASGASN